jgi:hypothetical protein
VEGAMSYQTIYQSANLVVHWYKNRGIIHAAFLGELLPEISAMAYKMSNEFLQKYGTERYRGVITDFRQVTVFPNANTTVTRNQSKQINAKMDLTNFPIALLVDTYMQEKIVWMVAEINGTAYRSKIVRSLEEGFEFIDDYRSQQNATT